MSSEQKKLECDVGIIPHISQNLTDLTINSVKEPNSKNHYQVNDKIFDSLEEMCQYLLSNPKILGFI